MKADSENKTQGEPVDPALTGVRHLNKLILESAEGGILNKDFFLVGERLLWVVCGLTISAIERPLFHTNYYDNWAKWSSRWIWVGAVLMIQGIAGDD
jgi:hypothetical protein